MQYILAIIFIIIVYLIYFYNETTKLKNKVKEAFSTMDIYLKKRWDLIPNLVECVKAYDSHEKEVFEEITRLRSNSYENLKSYEKIDINKEIVNPLYRLVAIQEQYPELKSDTNYQKLMEELTQVEDEIANSRKFYNALVKKYNTHITIFPNNILAKCMKYDEKKMFETEERNNVNINI